MRSNKIIGTMKLCAALSLSLSLPALAGGNDDVADEVIEAQRAELAHNTDGKGFGPQAPRDIDDGNGANERLFSIAPSSDKMNLCNIHFHKYAEHKGGEFTTFAGNGDGHGHGTGYKYSGSLSKKELRGSKKKKRAVCKGSHSAVSAGDTIEVHYVHTSADVTPGPTLGACLSDSIKNPALRVEAQIYVVVNDKNAADFIELTEVGENSGYQQALHLPQIDEEDHSKGGAVEYIGSTTGPSYNENGSPFQVTWNVRKKVIKVDIATVGDWCEGNIFDEDHAHGVRNLVMNPDLLSKID